MAIRIDEYISRISAVSPVTPQNHQPTDTEFAEAASQDGDSYVSTIGDENEPLPCENYNDILQVIRRYRALEAQAQTSSDEESDFAKQPNKAAGAGSVGGSGGGSGSEEETTTEIVVIDGITYLETTTVIGGITTVQRTVISGEKGEETDLMSGLENALKVDSV